MPNKPLEVISLGAGVQSSTMALMAAKGELTPMPDAAIFADTQAEPQSVYGWLNYLEGQLPFPLIKVTWRNLTEEELRVRQSQKSGRWYRSGKIPSYGQKGGMLLRRCTGDFKVQPILRKLRELVELPRRGREGIYVNEWMGISVDEAHRMKVSRESWIHKRYPLIDSGISRQACLEWMKQHGYPKPPRSACIFCPYHSDAEWERLRREEPEEFQKAVEFEGRMQEAAARDEVAKGIPFLHRSLIRLEEVPFSQSIKEGFGNDCAGVCGV